MIDTTGTSLQGPSNANADAGGSYAAGVTGDGETGAAVASDYSNGKATVDTTYQNTGGEIQKMIACCTAIVSGFSILGDSQASTADKEKAIASIEEGVAGVTVFVEVAAATGVELGLIAGGAALLTIPVVGWIAGAVLLVAAVLVSLVADTFASANAPIWTDQDQVNLTIHNMVKQFPTMALPGAPFTDSSRALAGYLASYVQSQLATSGDERQSKTAAIAGGPSGNAFGYTATVAGDMHIAIASQLGGNADQADALLSIVSVLWNPRWGGADDNTDTILGVGMNLDFANPQNILGGTLSGGVLTPVTSEKGLTAAEYLLETAAAVFLAKLSNAPGKVYAAVYLRLCQVAWLFKTSAPPDGTEVVPVPAALNATIGYMLDSAAQNNGIGLSTLIAPTAVTTQKTANPATATLAMGPKRLDLSYWVQYYLALGAKS